MSLEELKINTALALGLLALVVSFSTALQASRTPAPQPYPYSSLCPPGHVWVATGEVPQVGCMPAGTARELGVAP